MNDWQNDFTLEERLMHNLCIVSELLLSSPPSFWDASAIMNVFVVSSSWKYCKTVRKPASPYHRDAIIHKCTKWMQNYIQLAIMVVRACWDESRIYFIADAVNEDLSWMKMKRVEIAFLRARKLNLLFTLDSSVFEALGSVTVNSSVTNAYRLESLEPEDRWSRKTILIYESPDYENLTSQLTYLN